MGHTWKAHGHAKGRPWFTHELTALTHGPPVDPSWVSNILGVLSDGSPMGHPRVMFIVLSYESPVGLPYVSHGLGVLTYEWSTGRS